MASLGKKIIHVPRRFTIEAWGGTETVIASLATEQQQAGWMPEIHTSGALSSQQREMWRKIPIHRYPYIYPFLGLTPQQRQGMDQKGGNLLSFSLFFALLKVKEVRLFHAHALKRLGGEVLTAAKLRRKPCVVTLHGGVFDVPEAEREQMAAQRKKTWEWGKIFGWLLRSRRLLEEADALICVGLREYEEAKKTLSHSRIYHVGNGVHVGNFKQGDRSGFRRRHSIPQDALVMACYSRFDPQKNQMFLVKAFEKLAAKFSNLHLILAGPITVPSYLEEVDRTIKQSAFGSRIRRLGALDPESPELADAYHACDLFALSSRHEPFGIVVLEAWSARRPVVVSRVGGLQHLVEHGKDGFLFESEEIDSCTHYLQQLLENQELRKTMAQNGYQKASTSYSWSCIADKTEEIYQAAQQHCYKKQR